MKRSCLTSDFSGIPYSNRSAYNDKLLSDMGKGEISEDEYVRHAWNEEDLGPYGASRH